MYEQYTIVQYEEMIKAKQKVMDSLFASYADLLIKYSRLADEIRKLTNEKNNLLLKKSDAKY